MMMAFELVEALQLVPLKSELFRLFDKPWLDYDIHI